MTQLATAMQSSLRTQSGDNSLTVAAGAGGLTINSVNTGTADAITVSGVNLTNANAKLQLFTPDLGGGTVNATALLALTNAGGTAIANPVGASTLTGKLVLANNGITTTFVMGGVGGPALDASTNPAGADNNVIDVGGTNMAALMAAINAEGGLTSNDGLNLTASAGPQGGVYLQDTTEAGTTISMAGSTLAVAQTAGTSLFSQTAATANAGSASTVIVGPTNASTTLTMGGVGTTPAAGAAGYKANSMTVNANTDTLTGTLTITPGGATAGTPVSLNLNGQTLQEIQANAAWGAAGLKATLSAANTVLTFTAIAGSTVAPSVVAAGTITDSAAVVNTNDVVTGNITLTNSNGTLSETFAMGANANDGTGAGTYNSSTTTFNVNGNTLADLQNAINSQTTAGANSLGLGLTALASTAGLSVSEATNNGFTVGVSSSVGKTDTLSDTTQGTESSINMGTFASLNDAVSGNLTFTIGSNSPTTIQVNTANETVQGMINQINYGNVAGTGTKGQAYGVTATWVPPTTGQNFGSILLQSNTPGPTGNISAASETIADAPTAANLSYMAVNAYNTGISGSVSDHTTLQSAATFTSDSAAHSGTATISYSHGAGQSLSATDLTNQTNAKASLNALNAAITDVASQDGYIGAQINTLNSVSSVLATQQQNVVAAQNAVQATDYASAASNMSKYEILSQTGISALAQANSMQQEVTKLLQ